MKNNTISNRKQIVVPNRILLYLSAMAIGSLYIGKRKWYYPIHQYNQNYIQNYNKNPAHHNNNNDNNIYHYNNNDSTTSQSNPFFETVTNKIPLQSKSKSISESESESESKSISESTSKSESISESESTSKSTLTTTIPVEQGKGLHDPNQNIIIIPPQDDCFIPSPQILPIFSPVLIASYPGSGAKLTWKLIRAITGLMTGDDFDHNGYAKSHLVIAIKTHYPSVGKDNPQVTNIINNHHNYDHNHSHNQHNNHNLLHSILLLRHPMHALPSLCNFQYEISQGLPNHSTRAPMQDWILWRDQHFATEIDTWIQHAHYWMKRHYNNHGNNDNNHDNNLLIISFERIIDSNDGPKELQRIGYFLLQQGRDKNIPSYPTNDEEFTCRWDYIVNTRADQDTKRNSLRKDAAEIETHHHDNNNDIHDNNNNNIMNNIRPYTMEQLLFMEEQLLQLKTSYPSSNELQRILDTYLSQLRLHKQQQT